MARKVNIILILVGLLSMVFAMPAAASYIPFNTNVNAKIGIGTSSPGSNLSVLGGESLGSYATSTAPAGGIITSGNVGIGTGVVPSLLTIKGGNNITFTGVSAQLTPATIGTDASDQLVMASSQGSGKGTYLGPENGTFVETTASEIVLATGNGASTTQMVVGYGSSNSVGNVGIGSSTPGQKLDVQGTVRATAFIGNGAQLTGVTSSQWTTTNTNDVYLPSNGNVGIGTNITSAGAALTVMNGNVGIGTWVPGAPLQVNTSSGVGNVATFSSAGNGTWGITYYGAWTGSVGCGGYVCIQRNATDNFTARAVGDVGLQILGYPYGGTQAADLTQWENSSAAVVAGVTATGGAYYIGNVGLGTYTAVNQLVVNGAVGIGTANSSYVRTVAPSGGMIVQGNVGIGSLTPGQLLDVQGTVRALYFSGNGSQLTGITSSQWTTTNSNDVYLPSNGNVGLGTTFTSGGAALTVMNGNVGIGTWAPRDVLEVNGNVGIDKDIETYGTFAPIIEPDTANSMFNISRNDVPTRSYASFGYAGNVPAISTNNNGEFAWSNSNTNSNNYALSIVQPGGSGGTLEIIQQNSSLNGTNVGIGSFMVGSVGIGTNLSSAYVQVGTPKGGKLLVEGNVGIGTWLPVQALDVIGSIRLTNPGTNWSTVISNANPDTVMMDNLQGDVNGAFLLQSSATAAAPSFSIRNNANTGMYGPSGGNSLGFSTNGVDRVRIDSNGNVGIGTITPQAAFVVTNGNVGIGTWAPAALFQINKPSASPFIVNSSGNVGIGTTTPSGALTVMNGNVGIGTWVPATALEVNGTILADVQYNYPAGFGALADNGGNLHVPEALLDSGDSPGTSGECLTTTGTQVAWGSCSGNVGVGTGFPSSPLQSVQFNNNGNFGGSSNFVFNGTNVGIGTVLSKNTLDIGSNVSIGTAYAGYQAAPSNGLIVQGNVGVGTFAPVKPFSVVGDTYLNGNLGIGTATTTQGALVVTNGNVGIGTWVPGAALAVNGNISSTSLTNTGVVVAGANGVLTTPNGTSNDITFSGGAVVVNDGGAASTIAVNGNGGNDNYGYYLAGNGGHTQIGLETIDNWTGSNNVGADLGIVTYSDSGAVLKDALVVNRASGNIGLGTNFPSATLAIVGNVGIGTIGAGDYFTSTAPPKGGMIVEGNVGIGTWAPGGGLVVMNGNVGIGTTVPSLGELTIVPPSDETSLYIGNHAFNQSSIPLIVAGGNNGSISATCNAGNCISTTGAIYGTSIAGAQNGASVSAPLGILGVGVTGSSHNALGIYGYDDNVGQAAYFDTAAGTINTQFYRGNVGIGTFAAPGSKFIIDGGGEAIGTGTAYFSTYTAPSGGLIVQGNVGIGTFNPSQPFQVNSNSLPFVVDANSNVGIGTTSTTKAGLTVMNGNVGIGTWLPSSSLQVVGGGIQVGLPTGGDKGSGNINIAGDIYKNNAAYTNPDYVFEKYFTGNIIQFKNNPGASTYQGIKPISDVMTFTKIHHQLPLVSSVNGRGLFGKGDGLLASLEESYIYIFDLNKRVEELNEQNQRLNGIVQELSSRMEEMEKKMQSQQSMGNGTGNVLPKYKQSLEKENNNRRTL